MTSRGWIGFARHAGRRLPAAIHVDTGMCRLGLSADEARRAADDDLSGIDLVLVMSHLACAEDTDHPLNHLQLERFREAAALFPGVPRSLANSSGMFLGADWHFDLCRPGVALYGVNPTPGRPNPMLPVVTLEAPVLQQHDIAEVGTVGYGATRAVWPGERIVTVPVGYADGFPRSSAPAGRPSCWASTCRSPVASRWTPCALTRAPSRPTSSPGGAPSSS